MLFCSASTFHHPGWRSKRCKNRLSKSYGLFWTKIVIKSFDFNLIVSPLKNTTAFVSIETRNIVSLEFKIISFGLIADMHLVWK
jgi:hypothetical protein